MFRYFVSAWNPTNATTNAAAALVRRRLAGQITAWKPTVRQPGLEILCSDAGRGSMKIYHLHDDAGVVLGSIFCTGDEGDFVDGAARLSERQACELVVRSRGRELVSAFWGTYVAVVRESRSCVFILRAPASRLPCFRAQFRGVHLFFSDVETCASLRLIPLTINWEYMKSHLLAPPVAPPTGLREVQEVMPGECVRIDASAFSRTELWNPGSLAMRDVIENPATAASLARTTVRACVHAQAAGHESLVLNLSGGLDPSIVLAALRDAPSKPRIRCLHHFSDGAASDGRRYARAVAGHFNVDLTEHERVARVDLASTLEVRQAPRPVRCVRRVEHSLAEATFANEAGAGAILTGDGGDELFHRNEPRLAAADFASLRGLRPRLFTLALEGALAERVSFWTVLREALSHRFARGDWDMFAGVYAYKTLIDDDVLATIRREGACRSPWCASTRIAPPGKLFHIYMLTAARPYYDPLGRETDPELVLPLLSQPLVELFLRIPTYVLKEGGWDRAVARRAFEADLPHEIAWRRSKGGIEEHAARIMTDNLPFLRSMLLDGKLLREGLLNRPRLEEALSGRPSSAWKGPSDVFNLLSVELWLRSWESYSVDVPSDLVA
jgi:asparagine synthase (glutamine-hydrolysing)